MTESPSVFALPLPRVEGETEEQARPEAWVRPWYWPPDQGSRGAGGCVLPDRGPRLGSRLRGDGVALIRRDRADCVHCTPPGGNVEDG